MRENLTSITAMRALAVGAARGENGELLLLIHPEGGDMVGFALDDQVGGGLIDALRQVLAGVDEPPAPVRH